MENSNRPANADPKGQEILDSLPFCAFLITSQRRILAGNDTVARDLGVHPASLVGAQCSAAIHGCTAPVTNCPLTEALRNGHAAEREVFDNRSERWFNVAVYPIPSSDCKGERIYLHFSHDITEFKKTARELSQTLEHQRTMSNLLHKMQHCHDGAQIMQALVDQIVCLSWLGMSAKAVGFLRTEAGLQLAVQ
jgi:PAS domain S-box-containing protein